MFLTGTYDQVTAAFGVIYEKMLLTDSPPDVVPSYYTLKLMLAPDQVGSILGRGGSVVKAIRERAGVRVRVLSLAEMPPGVCCELLQLHRGAACFGAAAWE